MIRKDDVRSVRDDDAPDVDAELRQHVELVEQAVQREDGPAADQQARAGDQHPGGDDAQRQLGRADFDRVTGVVAAAETGDHAVVARQQLQTKQGGAAG